MNHNKKSTNKSIVEPKDFIKDKLDLNLLKNIIPKYCILIYDRESDRFINLLKKKYKIKKIVIFKNRDPIYFLNYKNVKIGLAFYRTGAPISGMILEELIAIGFEKFIVIGECASLQKINIGDFILLTKAMSEEGTSTHYSIPSSMRIGPSKIMNFYLEKVLNDNNIPYKKGTIWTTDAPYRENLEKIKKYQKNSVLCVDMEASALFTIAKYRKKDVGALFYVTSSLADLKHYHEEFSSKIFDRRRYLLLKLSMAAFYIMKGD